MPVDIWNCLTAMRMAVWEKILLNKIANRAKEKFWKTEWEKKHSSQNSNKATATINYPFDAEEKV